MNSSESKDLIERVGGLEAAQFIVRDSPEDAEYVGFGCMYYKKSLDTTALMHCMAGQWINDCAYLNDELDSLPRFIKLSDLRTVLKQRPHPCATQCPNFTDEQCCHCLVGA